MTADRTGVDRDLGPVARWVVTGKLELLSATHLGGEGDGVADLVVVRDRVSGQPLLTGASLGGALRGYLTDRLDGYRAAEADPRVSRLFGAPRRTKAEGDDDEGSQSPLVVFDAIGETASGMTEIRDGVAIDARSGIAEDHKKFDLEVLPAGTTFEVRVELPILGRDDENGQMSALVSALDGLANGEIALGARRSRGLGRIRGSEWKAHRYELNSADGWLKWLTADPLVPLPGTFSGDGPGAACRQAYPLTLGKMGQPRRQVTITAHAVLRGGLLVRSPAAAADAPDVSHLLSAGHSVMPGTGVAGALRHRAVRILRAIGAGAAGDEMVYALFGHPVPAREDRGDDQVHGSRLWVGESRVREGERVRSSRIRVDRATQGVARTALFDEETHVGGKLDIILELRNPARGEVGLLLLLVKDLLTGDLPVGGSTAVGRGVLGGHAELSRPGLPDVTLLIDSQGCGQTVPGEAVALVDEEITDLFHHMSLAGSVS